MEPTLDVRVLGALQVFVDRQPVPLGGPRARGVLALLVVHASAVVPLDQAVEAVWGGDAPLTARTTLQAYLSRLRHVLGNRLRRQGAGYVLLLEPAELDALRLARLVDAVGSEEAVRARPGPAAQSLAAALALWSGPAYGNLADLAFVKPEAARLDELRLRALYLAAVAAVPLGEASALVPALAQAVQEHPLHEALVEQHVRLLYASARQAEALQALQECRRALADQLGIDLSPALRRLQGELLGQQPDLAPRRSQTPSVHTRPPRTVTFIGREVLLKDIARLLASGQEQPEPAMLVLHGLGGVGKTQLAIEHLHRCWDSCSLTWWVPASDRVAAAAALVEFARRLGIAERSQPDTLDALWDALRRRGDWLLVYDGAAGPREVRDLLPSAGRGRVLVTSRNPAWSQLGETLTVPVLSRAESVHFLQRRTGLDRAGRAGEAGLIGLAEMLGDLPLALEQASAYLEQTGMEIESYARLYEDRSEALLLRGAGDGHEVSVATTWQLAFDEVASHSPAAGDLLGVMAFLAPEPVSLAGLAELEPDPLALQDAVATLLRFSLVAREGDGLRMHRLVAAVLRNRPDATRRRELIAAAVSCLQAGVAQQGAPGLVPHVRALNGFAAQEQTCPPALPALVQAAADVLRRAAAYPDAAQTLEAGLATAEAGGSDQKQVADLLTDLGRVLDAGGDVRGAKKVQEQALALLEQSLGPSALPVARALNRLGHVLMCAGEGRAAVEVHQRALEMLHSHPTATAQESAQALIDCGSALWATGDLAASRPRYEQALDMLGPSGDMRLRAEALGGLGQVFQDAGDLVGACACQEQSVAEMELACRPEHPDVGQALDKLGYVVRLLGQVQRSVQLHSRAVDGLSAALGPSDPRVAMARTNLGLALLDSGHLAPALQAQAQAVADFRAAYGPDHPHVAMAERRHAAVLTQTQDPARGIPAGGDRLL